MNKFKQRIGCSVIKFSLRWEGELANNFPLNTTLGGPCAGLVGGTVSRVPGGFLGTDRRVLFLLIVFIVFAKLE